MQPMGAPAENVDTTMPLVLSIICTVLCCLPLGVVGIVFAAMAMGAKNSGDFVGAADKARKARLFALIGIGIGLVVTVLYVLLFVILGIGAAAAGSAGTP